MSLPIIRRAFERYLGLISTGIATAYQNDSFTPDVNLPFQRVDLMPNTPDNQELGNRSYLERGLLQITLAYPLNKGSGAAEARAQAIRLHFRRGIVLVEAGLRILITKTPAIAPALLGSSRYEVPITVEWQCHIEIFEPRPKFTPAFNFGVGKLGIWQDFSDFATQSQDSTGTTAVTGIKQLVGRVLDKSGNANATAQATATSRPIVNSRINLFALTDNPEHWIWNAGNLTAQPLVNGWGKLVEGIENRSHDFFQLFDLVAGQAYTYTRKYKAGERTLVRHKFGDWDNIHIGYLDVNLATKQITDLFFFGNCVYVNSFIKTNADGSVTVSLTVRYTVASQYLALAMLCVTPTNAPMQVSYQGDGVSGLYSAEPDFRKGIKFDRYQWVGLDDLSNTDGFPIYHAYQIDDFMACAVIALGPDMDCFISVNRAGVALQPLFSTIADVALTFGFIEVGSAVRADAGCGVPTYAVNGVAVNNDLAGVTRGQLATAMPQDEWVVLEIKNLNLSAVTSLRLGAFAANYLDARIGGYIICQAGDADRRQENRQYVGGKVGLTLP